MEHRHEPSNYANTSSLLLEAFFIALAERRAGELGSRGEAFLSEWAYTDPDGSVRLSRAMQGLVTELAPWLRGDGGADGKTAVTASSIELVDPTAPGGVHYELDATSGPELSAVLDDLKHADANRRRGLEPPNRLLLEGPAGCGKTQAAVLLARELKKKLAVVMLAKLISKWVGETGARFLAAVEEARDAGAVFLVDELDAVGSHRTESDQAGATQVVGAMNQILEDPKNRDLLIIGATNLPDMIDPAVARRFQTRIRFSYPDAATRERIALHHWRLAPLAAGTLDALVARTDGKSGDALVRAAHAANRAAGRRGRAAADGLAEASASEVAAALRAAVIDGVVSDVLRIRVAAALSDLEAEPAVPGARVRGCDLYADATPIEVSDVVAALAGLTREVPLDREPSLIVRPGTARGPR